MDFYKYLTIQKHILKALLELIMYFNLKGKLFSMDIMFLVSRLVNGNFILIPMCGSVYLCL